MEKSKYNILKVECILKSGKKIILYGSAGRPCDDIEDFRKKLKNEMSINGVVDHINLTYEERD